MGRSGAFNEFDGEGRDIRDIGLRIAQSNWGRCSSFATMRVNWRNQVFLYKKKRSHQRTD